MSRRSGGRRRRKVVWDTLNLVQADLPLLTLDSTQARDGAFSGIKRWIGADVTILRTLMLSTVRITYLDFPVDTDTVLELCIGLSAFDSMGDADGLAINTTLANNTGPLTDADNSKWFARCCVLIPLGSFVTLVAANDNLVVPLVSPRGGPGGGHYVVYGGGAGAQEITWYCEWDSRTKRRLQGAETPLVNVALEARTSSTPAVGDDITIAMNAFQSRIVRTSGGISEL